MCVCPLILSSAVPAWAQNVSEQEAYEIARDAYVYAYPLMVTDAFTRQGTNYAEPTGIVTQAPYNQFSHARAFPPADFKAVVRPNVDTLYSSANLDLGPEPMVLSVPATDGYFILPLLSMWTDVFAAQYKLTPLSAWGKGEYVPPKGRVDPSIDMKTPPPVQVGKMGAVDYFGRFAELLKDNPPGPFDYPIVHRLERVGFKVGQSFDLSSALPEIKQAFGHATTDGRALVSSWGKQDGGEGGKGWV
jgi:hypothetical protein